MTQVANVSTALMKGHVIWYVCVTIFTQIPAIQIDSLTSGCEVTSEGKKIYKVRGGLTRFLCMLLSAGSAWDISTSMALYNLSHECSIPLAMRSLKGDLFPR